MDKIKNTISEFISTGLLMLNLSAFLCQFCKASPSSFLSMRKNYALADANSARPSSHGGNKISGS
jgi:hypothetical protein